ncbi:MAG: hypothetical protein AAGK05_19200, partial [Pseudomonadota bacterium]
TICTSQCYVNRYCKQQNEIGPTLLLHPYFHIFQIWFEGVLYRFGQNLDIDLAFEKIKDTKIALIQNVNNNVIKSFKGLS